jgi:4-carboxymuconolactone decarboxylase
MSAIDTKVSGRARGEATRREVLGSAHVDRALAATTEFDAPFQELITEAAWSRVWSRDTWSKRQRSIVTIALLAALGHHDELAMHVRAVAHTGATEEDVREALLHVAIYAGVPNANTAFRIAKEVFAEMRAGKAE